MNVKLIREYVNEVLTGFELMNASGRSVSTSNIRQGDLTLGHKNKGVLDDEEDDAQKNKQDMDSLPQAACVFIQRKDGKILTVSRKNNALDVGLPGGHVDPGESHKEAAARELEEETGTSVKSLVKIFADVDDNGYYVTTFAGTIDGSQHIDTEEVGVVRWVDKEALLNSSFNGYNTRLLKSLGLM